MVRGLCCAATAGLGVVYFVVELIEILCAAQSVVGFSLRMVFWGSKKLAPLWHCGFRQRGAWISTEINERLAHRFQSLKLDRCSFIS